MWHSMAKRSQSPTQTAAPARVRRSYFECLYGQLHVHHAIPAGGGFEEATPLLALHAAAQTGRMFGGILAAMGADRSAFAPDLPAFGQSDGPREALTAADHAAAIGDFLDAMRLRQVDVLGCGLGALVAIELALSRPNVRRVAVMPLPPEAGQRNYPLSAQMARIAQPTLLLYPRDMTQALLTAAAGLPVRARRELPGDLSLLETAPETVADVLKDFLG
jgi:pimeloyl-ACP methyl ester carboxylesterase